MIWNFVNMADLYSTIEKLKNVIKAKSLIRRRSDIFTKGGLGDPNKLVKLGKEYIGLPKKINSRWMKQLEYYPIEGSQSGSVVMRVKTGPVAYIYPRIGQKVFVTWIDKKARGGKIYWYGVGTPSLKDYSIVARKSHRGRKTTTGRIGNQQLKKRQLKKSGFSYIPTKIRMKAVRGTRNPRKK
jgi:hypothetical protein